MRTAIAAAAIAACLAPQAPKAETPDTLTFGIVPQQSASRLARMWGPLMAELGRETGLKIRFRTNKDIPTFEACLAKGVYDIAYMNPYHYVVYSNSAGYEAFAHQTKKKLRGVLVVRKDSPVQSLDDLAGTDIAFPSPAAFGASVLPRAELQGAGVAFTPSYVKSHDSVYRAVAAGHVAAGGGVLRTWNAVDPEIRDQLRIVYETHKYTPHAVAVSPDIDPLVRNALADALAALAQRRPALVAGVGMAGFQTARDEDWDDVRGLGLDTRQTGIAKEDDIACPSG